MNRISLIIPAYNEEKYLPLLLDSVDRARDRFHLGPSSVEVVVADNRSTDETARIARGRGCRVVNEDRRIIAAVRNAGARASKGDFLAFTDADNIIHPETFNRIDKACSSPRVVGGSTGVRLERISPGIALAYAVVVPLVWATGMDAGVVFCRKTYFQEIGGYDEGYLFGEDVDFLWRLIKKGKSHGQRLIRIRKCKAMTSARKFDQFGDWHYIALVFTFLLSLIIPRYSIDRFAKAYWYSDDRTDSKKTIIH